jgi:hypothetical protein
VEDRWLTFVAFSTLLVFMSICGSMHERAEVCQYGWLATLVTVGILALVPLLPEEAAPAWYVTLRLMTEAIVGSGDNANMMMMTTTVMATSMSATIMASASLTTTTASIAERMLTGVASCVSGPSA